MSLRQFHIFFITLSVMLCFGFGVWGIDSYAGQANGGTNLILGLLSFLVGAVLIAYGFKVFQKLRTL